MTKVVITGAGGRVGRAFAEFLAGGSGSLAPAFPAPLEVVPLSHADLDVTRHNDVEACLRRQRPQLVVNAAGFTDIERCEQSKWAAYLVNRDGADHLARSCADVDALMVHFSTDLVFDGARPIPYEEEDPPNPLNIYADTKLAGELAVMKKAPRHLLIRTGWLFGGLGRTFITNVLEWLSKGESIFGFDDHVSQPTRVEDLVRAAGALLAKGRTGTWHIASRGEATEYEVAQHIAELLKMPEVEVLPLRRLQLGRTATRPQYSALSCAKLEAEGISMPAWKEAVTAYVRSIRDGGTKVIR